MGELVIQEPFEGRVECNGLKKMKKIRIRNPNMLPMPSVNKKLRTGLLTLLLGARTLLGAKPTSLLRAFLPLVATCFQPSEGFRQGEDPHEPSGAVRSLGPPPPSVAVATRGGMRWAKTNERRLGGSCERQSFAFAFRC